MPLFQPEPTPSCVVVRARIRRCTYIWEVLNWILFWYYNYNIYAKFEKLKILINIRLLYNDRSQYKTKNDNYRQIFCPKMSIGRQPLIGSNGPSATGIGGRKCRSKAVQGESCRARFFQRNARSMVMVKSGWPAWSSSQCGMPFHVPTNLSENKRRGVIIHADMLFSAVGFFEILFFNSLAATGKQSG